MLTKRIIACLDVKDNKVVKTEFYKGHSEAYAESAAENYVLGIKKINAI